MSADILSSLRSRECSLTDINVPDAVIDRFICHRHDEHFIETEDIEDVPTPLACQFSKVDPHILGVADENGGLIVFNTCYKGFRSVKHDWLAHKNAIFDIDWMPHENKLLTASGDQTVALWDVQNEEQLCVYKGHTGSVKTARFGPNNKWIFATGARDGHILLFDSRIKKKGNMSAIDSIKDAHKSQPSGTKQKKNSHIQMTTQSVTAVVFQDDHTLISGASVDGTIRVWDLRKTYSVLKTKALPKHIFKYAGTSKRIHGFSSLILDQSGTKLFASCMDNVIYQYDTATFSANPVVTYRGHQNGTFYVKSCLSPDEQFIISGSSDNLAYIWRLSDPTSPPWTLQGHSGEVSAVEWCPGDIGKIVTVSDDAAIRIWHLSDSEQLSKTTSVIGEISRQMNLLANDSNLSRNKQMPLTPKKGVVIRSSPVKRSVPCSPSMKLVHSNPKNSNLSSIMQWLANKPKWEPSPVKRTPKKLVITPKKQTPLKCVECSDYKNNVCRQAKRKLYEQESPTELEDTKRHHHDDYCYDRLMHQDENSCDDGTDHKSDGTSSKMDVFRNSTTPLKTLQSPQQFHSPTMNLPNYVLDPHPRTPVAKPIEPVTPKTPNWLMELQKQKSVTKQDTQISSDCIKTKPQHTPTSKRREANWNSKRSIVKYFSPSAAKKKEPS